MAKEKKNGSVYLSKTLFFKSDRVELRASIGVYSIFLKMVVDLKGKNTDD